MKNRNKRVKENGRKYKKKKKITSFTVKGLYLIKYLLK